MAVIKPFRGIRPKKGLESQVAALPYDVYSSEEAREVVKGQPYSFLNIDRAETQFPVGTDPYSDEVYDKAKEMFWNQVAEGIYVTENAPVYYVYELIMDGRSQTGLVACASIDDYQNEIIKKHENTRAYRFDPAIDAEINKTKADAPLYDFTADDGITHKAWIISDADSIRVIQDAFEKMNDIYIADGHHRCASAVKVGLKKREENPGYTGEEEFNFFLSVLFPDEQLMIMDYNRVVKDLGEYSEESFMDALKEIFDIEPIGTEPKKPASKGEIAMFISEKWYLLKVKDAYKSNDPIKGLDVSILQDYVLSPMLHIDDPKTDKRIDFVGGIRGYAELERRVHKDCKVAFGMYPTSIGELFAVADAHLLMPPKSTWFEPKLRSGLFVHSIKD